MTRREFNVSVGTATVGAAVLPLTGCSTSGLITALDVTETACTVAAPLVQVFAVELGPFAIVASTYLQSISGACSNSVTELDKTPADTKAQQDIAIAGYFAVVALISVPTNLAPEVSAAIAAVIAGVQLILNLLGKGPAPTPTAAVKALGDGYKAQAKALGSDQARKADILAKHEHMKKLSLKHP